MPNSPADGGRGTPRRESCIKALQLAEQRLGFSPRREDYEGLLLTPSATTITNEFGSWNKAKEAAGLKTFEVGSHPNWRLTANDPPESMNDTE